MNSIIAKIDFNMHGYNLLKWLLHNKQILVQNMLSQATYLLIHMKGLAVVSLSSPLCSVDAAVQNLVCVSSA